MILKKESLDSSQLKDIQLNTETHIMTVKFQDRVLKSGIRRPGAVYNYENVPEEIYNTIINAKENPLYEYSHGKCFHQLIKLHEDLYPYTPVNQ